MEDGEGGGYVEGLCCRVVALCQVLLSEATWTPATYYDYRVQG